MIAGIMSDSHDNLTRIAGALEIFRARNCGVLIHLGDFVAPFSLKAMLRFQGGPIHAVYGNNDGERAGLAKLLATLKAGPVIVEIEGRKIGMAHDRHQLPQGDQGACDAILFGHSHSAELTPASPGNPLILNPGETCGWLTGKPTCAVLDLETMEAEIVEIG